MKLFKIGFSLSEALLTLSILGIISVLTIPNLIKQYNERLTVAKVKNAYSLVNELIRQSISINGHIKTWDIGNDMSNQSSAKLIKYIEPNLQYIEKCVGSNNNKGKCFALFESYKTFTGKQSWLVPSGNHDNTELGASYLLKNGIAIRFISQGNTNCRKSNGRCIIIQIDVNGNKGPNKVGIDYFPLAFIYSENKYSIKKIKGECKYKTKSSANNNGYGCALWILDKNNMDYLKRDIDTEYTLLSP